MARNYKTGLIITGDASGGIRAIKATDNELGKLNKGFDRGSRRSKQFSRDVGNTSQGLAVLRRAAAPIAGMIAGMFAANTLQSQVDWGDQLQKTNLRIGASTEALSQYNYVAKLSGVEFGQLTTAWQRQTRRIAEAAAGTGVAVAALDRLKLSATELNQLAPEDQFERIAAAMQNVESSSERVRLAQQLWDSEGVKLVQIVNSGTDAIAAMRAEADALGLTITQQTADSMASYNDEMDRLRFAAQGVTQTLLADLIPSLVSGAQATNRFLASLRSGELEQTVTVMQATAGAAGGVAAAYLTVRGAVIATTIAQTALNVAMRANPMMLLASAAAAVAGGLWAVNDSMSEVERQASQTAGEVRGLAQGFEHLAVAQQASTRSKVIDDLTRWRLEAAELGSEITKLTRLQRQSGQLTEQGGALEVITPEQLARGRQAREELAGLLTQIGAGSETLKDMDAILAELNGEGSGSGIPGLGDATETSTAASREAAKANNTLADSYESLLDRITPNRSEARQYAQDLGRLNLALASGRMNTVQYMQAMGLLQESFQAAQRETDKTAQASEDASQRIANSFTTWGTVADNTLRSVDDAGRDAWLGLIDGSTSALDTVERAFQQTFANIAHMLTTQKLTFEVAGMMGLDTTGMPGGGAGGLNLSSIGSLGKTVSGWFGGGAAASGSLAMQGGLSSAALASAGQVAGGAAYSGALGSAASGAALGNAATASGGFMGAASAAMPWVAGGMVIDEVLGLGIVDGIVSGISGLFGSSPTAFSGRFGTTATLNRSEGAGKDGVFEHQSGGRFYGESALGFTGFRDQGTERLQRAGTGDKDWAEELTNAAVEMDNLVASLAQTKPELTAMQSAVQGLETSSRSAADIVEFALNERPRAALEALGGDFGVFVRGLSGGIEEVVQQAQTAQQAHEILASGMDRLNLQFDASTAGAYAAAGSIAGMVGGIENLTSLQSTYYDNFLSEGERAAHLQNDLAISLAAIGMRLPETRRGYRDLVEAQDLNTEAGQRTYAQLMQLAPAFAEVVTDMGDMGSAVDRLSDQLSAARDVMSTAEDAVLNAWEAFESQSFKQQITLLESVGESQAALALQRERELLSIDPLLHETQRVIWSIEDETQAKNGAAQAAQRYVSELSRVRDQLSSTFGNIAQWVDQQNATSGTPGVNLAEAQDQLARQLVLAESGDRSALQSITQYADRVLQANEAYNASGPAGQSIRDEVLGALENLPDQISAEEYIADEIKQALREQTQGISDNLSGVLRGDNPSNIAGNLAGYFETLAGGIDGVLTPEQLAIVMSGKATDAELKAIMRAVDLNGDGVMNGLESVIIAGMPTDAILGTVLRNKMAELDKNQLTHAQIRTALSPIATDAEISNLINRMDVNGDGIVTQQELTNSRIGGLSGGIAASLSDSFKMLDSNLDDNLTYSELTAGLKGIATNAQIKAMMRSMDLSGDGIINKLESVVIKSMPTDTRLATLLRNKMTEVGARQLTSAQVRNALSPIATDAEISRLIREVDVNGDGIISKQELTNARVGGLATGIAKGLDPAFDMLDSNLDGKLTFSELSAGLEGMASDAELRRIFGKLDEDGNGTISRLEALKRSGEGTEDNTKSLEQRAYDQLSELNGLVGEMTRTTDQFIGLNSNIVSLGDSINALGVAQAEVARIEKDRAAAEKAERERIGILRQAEEVGAHIDRFDDLLTGQDWNKYVERDRVDKYKNYSWITGDEDDFAKRIESWSREGRFSAFAARYESFQGGRENQLEGLRDQYRTLTGSLAPFANGGWTGPGSKWEPAGIVHAGEVVWSQDDVSRFGGVGAVESLRTGSRQPPMPPMPNIPMPQFPALGQNDVLQVLNDVRRELVETRKQNQKLQEENNRHAAAAVAVQQEGFKRQISEQQKGNRSLEDMGAAARLEALR